MPGDKPPPTEAGLNATLPAPTLHATATVLSLDQEARREGLSVSDQIALQDSGLRQRMARWVMSVFIVANLVTLGVIAGLIYVDQADLISKLISPNERIVGPQVILGLLGATTVQAGTIAVIITRYLFPARPPQA